MATDGTRSALMADRPIGGRLSASTGGRDAAIFAAAGAVIWWACRNHAAALPAWAPWEFSLLWYAAFALTGWCYVRGVRRERPAGWRIAVFCVGMLSIWAVLQTRYEYLAQHMFFYNRIQHVVMHHLGPFLIALAWPWSTILGGAPGWLRRIVGSAPFSRMLRVMQQPAIACTLFVGLIALWLFPPVHVVAMINPLLYQFMNWSMVVDGLLFWCVVIDPRDADQAHNSFGGRAAMAVLVILPQIAIGAAIAFANTDLYAFYAWCGRIYPTIDALSDQRIGGMIVWIPPAMMSVIGLLLVLNFMRIEDERANPSKPSGGVSSAAWTGR
jgi:putative membrane protein